MSRSMGRRMWLMGAILCAAWLAFPAPAWARRLVPFEILGDDYQLPVDPEQPLKVRLTGKIQLFCRYGGHVVVDKLDLVRSGPADKTWRPAPAEVTRTAKWRTIDPQKRVRIPRPGEPRARILA